LVIAHRHSSNGAPALRRAPLDFSHCDLAVALPVCEPAVIN
jgi:hypothetical protein